MPIGQSRINSFFRMYSSFLFHDYLKRRSYMRCLSYAVFLFLNLCENSFHMRKEAELQTSCFLQSEAPLGQEMFPPGQEMQTSSCAAHLFV